MKRAAGHNGERIDWMARPDEFPALVICNKVRTLGGLHIGDVIALRRYKNNSGHMLACIRVRGTNGATYHGRVGAAKTLVKLRRVKT